MPNETKNVYGRPLTEQERQVIKALWEKSSPWDGSRMQVQAALAKKGYTRMDIEIAIRDEPYPAGDTEQEAVLAGLLRGGTGGMWPEKYLPQTTGGVPEFDIPYLSEHGLGPIPAEMFQKVSPSRAIGQAVGFSAGPLAAGRAVGKGLFSLLGSQPAMKTAYGLAGQAMPKLTGILSPLAREIVGTTAGMIPIDYLTTLIKTGDPEEAEKVAAIGIAMDIPVTALLQGVPMLWRGRVAKALKNPEVQLAGGEIKSTLQPNRQADLEAAFGVPPELSAAHPQRQADLEAAFGGPITDRMRDIAERAEQGRAFDRLRETRRRQTDFDISERRRPETAQAIQRDAYAQRQADLEEALIVPPKPAVPKATQETYQKLFGDRIDALGLRPQEAFFDASGREWVVQSVDPISGSVRAHNRVLNQTKKFLANEPATMKHEPYQYDVELRDPERLAQAGSNLLRNLPSQPDVLSVLYGRKRPLLAERASGGQRFTAGPEGTRDMLAPTPEQAFRTQVDNIVAQAGESAAALRRWHQDNAARINAGGTTPERAALARVETKLRAATEESAAGRRIRQQAAEEAQARPTEPATEIPEAEAPPVLPPFFSRLEKALARVETKLRAATEESAPPQAVPVAPGMVRSAPVAPPRATSGVLGSLADELRAGGLVRMDKSVGEWEGLPRSRYSGRSRVGSLTQGRSVDEWAADLMKNRPDLGIRSGDDLRRVILEGGERLYGRPVDFEARVLQVEEDLAARMGTPMTAAEQSARVPFSLEAPPVAQVRPRAGGPDVSPEIPGIKPRPKVPTTRLPGGARTEGLGGTELDPERVRTQQDMAGVRQDQLPLEPSRAADISRIDQVEVEIRELDDAIREARRVGRAGDEVALTGAREMEAERDALLIKREELRRTPAEGAAPRGGAGPDQSQQRKLFGLLQKAGIRYNTPEYEDFLRTTTGKSRFRDLTYEEAQRAISDANTMAAREAAGRAERVIGDVNAEANKVAPADRVTLAGPEGEPVKDLGGTLARWFGSPFGKYHISKVPAGKMIVDEAEFSVRHMNLWTRDLATRVRDFNIRTKLGLADKYQIARALDGAVEVSELTARQARGYRWYRQFFNHMATVLGLPEDLRVSEYFPHIFHGTMGKRLAALAASEGADPQGTMGVTVRGIRDIEQVPVEKLFPHLLRREGATGYVYDLDEVIWTYIRGASRKIWMDRFLATAKQRLDQIPDSVLKVEAARYASAIAGVQDLSRQAFARNLASKEWFDWAFDRLVMKLAPEEARGTLLGTPKNAVTFLESISKLAQKPIPGYPRGEASSVVDRMRARVALKADVLRDALQNPNAPPVLSNALYRAFVWQRLGANIGWGFINYTEYLTNVLPTLGKHAVRAVADYANYRLGDLRRIEGIPVHKILRDVQLDENTFLEMLDPTRSKVGGAVERLITAPGRIPERHIRSIAQIALFRRGIARGLSPIHALETASTELKTIKFGGGKVYMPPALRNPLVHHMLMFTSWGIHQVQFSAGLLEDAAKGLNLIRKSASEGARADIFARQVAPFLAHAGVYAAAWGAGEALGLDIIGRFGHPLVEFGKELYKGNYNALTNSVTRQMGMPAAEVTLDVMLGVLNSLQGEDTDWNKIVERSLAPAPFRRLMSMDRRNVSRASGKGVLEMLTGIRADDERRRRKRRKRRAQQ